MPKSLQDVKRELHARVDELRPLVEEYEQLERAADALGGATSGRSRAAAPRAAKGPATKRAPRGGNKRAVFGVIAERPGVSVGEIAETAKIRKPLVYGVTRAGVERGELEVVELGGGRKGFKLADQGASNGGQSGTGRTLEEATEGIGESDSPPPVGG